jgi:hypothetical protein
MQPATTSSRPALRRRSRPGATALLAAALLLLLLSHPLIHGDGVSYLIYLDSIAADGDLDLSNQVERFAPAIVYPYASSPVTGTPVTPFPFGSAFLLAPLYYLGRALESAMPALRAHPEHFLKIQGLPLAYGLVSMLGAQIYALASIGLTYATARRLAPGWAAALAALGCLAGTPLLYYATVEPLDAHVYGAFALALAIWLAARWSTNRQDAKSAMFSDWAHCFAVGLALGLAVLVRWQLLLYAVALGLALAWGAGRAKGWRAGLAAGLWVAAGLGLYCAVCALYFWRFFGAPLLVPNDVITGQTFVGAPLRYLPQVLAAGQNGWLSWSPIAGLGLAGLAGIALGRAGQWRALALAGLAGIALELALNGSIDDWYAGWSFGQRRMTEAYPLLAIGLAWLIGRGRWGWLIGGAALLCALYGALLLVAHLYYTHTSGQPGGGGAATVIRWLLTGPHGPALHELFRDRYGPWAWAHPEL